MLWKQKLARVRGNVWEGRALALLPWSQAQVSEEILWIVMMTSVPYESHLSFIAVPSMYCVALSRSLPTYEFQYTLLISDHEATSLKCVMSFQNKPLSILWKLLSSHAFSWNCFSLILQPTFSQESWTRIQHTSTNVFSLATRIWQCPKLVSCVH